MKKTLSLLFLLIIVFTSCQDDDINLFDKSGDERTAEAIANLKEKLTSSQNGWRLKYKPVDEAGSFYVIMRFNEDNTVNIQSDLTADDGDYFNQTNTYRIDSSLGLELIIESYSLFSYLFERDQATFLAEYEFDYVNETPDGSLVFKSKTDPSNATILLFEQAVASDINLLGPSVASNLDSLTSDFFKITSTQSLRYLARDLSLDVSLNSLARTIRFGGISKTSDRSVNQEIGFETTYIIEGNAIVLEEPFSGVYLNNELIIESIELTEFSQIAVDFCGSTKQLSRVAAVTSQGDAAILESTLFDVGGMNFAQVSDQFIAPLDLIFDSTGFSSEAAIREDILGAEQMQLYYNYEIEGGEILNGIGFFIQNEDGTRTFALKQFTLVNNGNNIIFQFAEEISVFESPTPANLENVNKYLNALTRGNNTYVIKIQDGAYEFYNPCSNWIFAFLVPSDE